MGSNVKQLKSALRADMRDVINNITSQDRVRGSEQICSRLSHQVFWQEAQSIMLFAPMPEETDIWPLIRLAMESGKRVALPFYMTSSRSYVARQVQDLQEDIEIGAFGIREPVEGCDEVPLNRLDLVLVPGLAFDTCGRRLGRGKGFYDQLLTRAGGIKCGVTFDEQIVDLVPVEPHDVRVNCILTPTRCIET